MDYLRPILARLPIRSDLNPARDWFILIGFATIVLAAIVSWNIWAFDTVATGGVIGDAPVKTEPLISQTSMETIRSVFAKRADEEIKYVTGTYRFTDPSQ